MLSDIRSSLIISINVTSSSLYAFKNLLLFSSSIVLWDSFPFLPKYISIVISFFISSSDITWKHVNKHFISFLFNLNFIKKPVALPLYNTIFTIELYNLSEMLSGIASAWPVETSFWNKFSGFISNW